jgi:hypothetical protein
MRNHVESLPWMVVFVPAQTPQLYWPAVITWCVVDVMVEEATLPDSLRPLHASASYKHPY